MSRYWEGTHHVLHALCECCLYCCPSKWSTKYCCKTVWRAVTNQTKNVCKMSSLIIEALPANYIQRNIIWTGIYWQNGAHKSQHVNRFYLHMPIVKGVRILWEVLSFASIWQTFIDVSIFTVDLFIQHLFNPCFLFQHCTSHVTVPACNTFIRSQKVKDGCLQ